VPTPPGRQYVPDRLPSSKVLTALDNIKKLEEKEACKKEKAVKKEQRKKEREARLERKKNEALIKVNQTSDDVKKPKRTRRTKVATSK